ncbi:hypothetical protein BDV97DRAFT_390404 [Delphinella strobiligena]|nr:hypothetical protein BDV97DRAFT_390404 [Delphinella strobiligena]
MLAPTHLRHSLPCPEVFPFSSSSASFVLCFSIVLLCALTLVALLVPLRARPSVLASRSLNQKSLLCPRYETPESTLSRHIVLVLLISTPLCPVPFILLLSWVSLACDCLVRRQHLHELERRYLHRRCTTWFLDQPQ